jgi:voltage-gated potassium channel
MVMTLIGAQNPNTFAGEIVAIVVAIVSVGVLVSFMTQILGPAALAQYWEGHRVRKARRMKDHIILCGDSDTARVLLERIPKDRLLIVAKDRARAESLTGSGFAVVAGDYETAEALRRAGIETSRAVIAASAEDSENAFVCLTAKTLAPNVPVLATASNEENLDKLRAVRADHIVSPALLSAAEILRTLAPVGTARAGG